MTRSPRIQMMSGCAALVRSTVEWSFAIPLNGDPTCRSASTATRKDRSPGHPRLNSCSATVRLAGSSQNAHRPSVTTRHPTNPIVDAHTRRCNCDRNGCRLRRGAQPRVARDRVRDFTMSRGNTLGPLTARAPSDPSRTRQPIPSWFVAFLLGGSPDGSRTGTAAAPASHGRD